MGFQSTLPAREATTQPDFPPFFNVDFNPRFPRGKRRKLREENARLYKISIHASREGSDFSSASASLKSWHISIHASREGSDG